MVHGTVKNLRLPEGTEATAIGDRWEEQMSSLCKVMYKQNPAAGGSVGLVLV